MADGHELGYQSLIVAAETAAADGDLRRTAALFREAIQAQEQELGPAHPGLASTCNNLAVVCERAGQIPDAEYYYRRAHAIAVSLLDAKDPLVQTSFSNLKEFCEAHGLPLDDWPEIAAKAPEPPPPGPRPASLSTVPRPRRPGQASGSARRVKVTELEVPDADVADLFGVYASSAAPIAPSIPVQPALKTTPDPVVVPAAPAAPAANVANVTAPLPAPQAPAQTAAGAEPAAPTMPAVTPGGLAKRPAPLPLGAALVAASVVATLVVVWRGLPSDTGRVSGASPAPLASTEPSPPAPSATDPSPNGVAAAPSRSSPSTASPAAAPSPAPSRTPPVTPAAPAGAPAERAATPASRPLATEVPAPSAKAVPTPGEPRDARTATGAPTTAHLRVVTTGVCTTLDTRTHPWRCAAVGDGIVSGPITYYTRITSTQARTRVEHRWYQDDVLKLTRSLSLAYSPTEGYRTYSRYSPAPGRWRVELVGPDGAVLHEARFEVR